MRLNLSRNACCWVCGNTLHLHCVAAMCHSMNVAPYHQQMARNTTCHSYLLLSIIKMRKKLPKQILKNEKWAVFLFCSFALFVLLLLPCELLSDGNKANKHTFPLIAPGCMYVLSICQPYCRHSSVSRHMAADWRTLNCIVKILCEKCGTLPPYYAVNK